MSTVTLHLQTLQDRLKYLVDLKSAGIAADFARAIGIAPATFHTYIKGRSPSVETLTGMRDTFSININWLLTGRGDVFGEEVTTTENTPEDLSIDLEVLHRIIKWVEERLKSEGKEMIPDKKARFIALAYEYFTSPEDGKNVDDKGMNQLYRLVV
ncbi:hypothetical protein [Desulfoluna butyratoxydans]|uniref:hypothetical protein n=1 Tax=Desulfoluna butyratoxydans TaxID=231438 RepID=UPI0015D29944|nr:hypothetical protein [Desulfoluna butyratoxydans]